MKFQRIVLGAASAALMFSLTSIAPAVSFADDPATDGQDGASVQTPDDDSDNPVDSGTEDGKKSSKKGKVYKYKDYKGATFKKGGATYKITGLSFKSSGKYNYLGKVELVSYNGKKKAVIPDTVEKKYKVTIDNGAATLKYPFLLSVTTIGAGAFNNAKGHAITSVSIGKNVAVIQDKAFLGCKHLTKIAVKGTAIKKVANNSAKTKFKKLKSSKVFKGTPRSCIATVPAPKKLDFSYVGSIRDMFSRAGFKGLVKY